MLARELLGLSDGRSVRNNLPTLMGQQYQQLTP